MDITLEQECQFQYWCFVLLIIIIICVKLISKNETGPLHAMEELGGEEV
jgi:hypothetical protein